MKSIAIKSIEKTSEVKKVYDIHHNIPQGMFYDKQPNLVTEAGTISNCGRHAGGVVLTDSPLEKENMPLVIGGKDAKRALQTPWTEGVNFRMLEHFGFLKFDFLALGTLRLFERTIEKILKKKTGKSHISFEEIKEWYDQNLSPDANPMTDLNVYKKVFWEGNHMSTFQFVKPNTQLFMKKMKPNCINDIAIATSIHRPGPLGLGADKDYLDNRANMDKVVYEHPFLESVLKPTSGLTIFQEQLQLIYNKLCGVPLDETDSVRKAFTKKEINNKEKAAKEREKLRTEFIEKSKKHAGFDEKKAGNFFDRMEKLVAYSFNASHAFSYSIATYQCAHLLTYHEEEWVTTCLDYAATEKGKVVGQDDPKSVSMREAQKLGYKFANPDINWSGYGYEMHPEEKKTIVPGFTSIKGIGVAALQEIFANRPYTSIEDLFVNRDGSWKHSKFTRKGLSTLVQLEALKSIDSIGYGKQLDNYKQLYNIVENNFDELKRMSARKTNNDVRARLHELIAEQKALKVEDWTKPEKIQFWLDLVGSVNLDLLLDDEYLKAIQLADLISIDAVPEPELDEEGQVIKIRAGVWFIIKHLTPKLTKTGKSYLELKVNGEKFVDLTLRVWDVGNAEAIIKNKKLKKDDVMGAIITKDGFGHSCNYRNLSPLQEYVNFINRNGAMEDMPIG
jgi:DNA polymerase-3 subunit alpha